MSSGTAWEARVGYSRAVRVGPFAYVSGTTAVDAEGTVMHPGDAGAQTHFALEKAMSALRELGLSARHVVRTRLFVTNIDEWQLVGDAHGDFFATCAPAPPWWKCRA